MSTATGYRMTPRLRRALTNVLTGQHGWHDEHARSALDAVDAGTDGDPIPRTATTSRCGRRSPATGSGHWPAPPT